MSEEEPRDHGLFAYFTSAADVDGEQVRFARSDGTDLLHWEELADSRPVLLSTVGTRGVRDPFLLRAAGLPGETASFYLIATDLRTWGLDPETAWTEVQTAGSRSIVVWESDDLLHWTEPRLAELAPAFAGNAWAPEAIFDPATGQYFVFWASAFAGSDGGGRYNRMLAAWTRDFRTFTPPFVWVDPGWSVIDATVVSSDDTFYRVIKDERSFASDLPASRYLTIERSGDLASDSYTLVEDGVGSSRPLHGARLQHGEGPILIWSAVTSQWLLFIDEFGLRRYVAFANPTLDGGRWTMVPQYRLPAGASHGSILPITATEWRDLASVAPALAGRVRDVAALVAASELADPRLMIRE